MIDLLDEIATYGNRSRFNFYNGDNILVCKDGFSMSVIAGYGTYSTPYWADKEVDSNYTGPYTHVEVGFPTEKPEPWDKWREFVDDAQFPTTTVYGHVPVELVRELVNLHGGLDEHGT